MHGKFLTSIIVREPRAGAVWIK